MSIPRNPFSKTVLGDDDPLCNQKDILSALMLEARSGNNNVLLAPRRSGKTSLSLRLARNYRADGGFATYVDLSAVASPDDAADRIATALFAALSVDKKLFSRLSKLVSAFVPTISMNQDGSFSVSASTSGVQKTGIEKLVSVAESLDSVSAQLKTPHLVILDEFQDLALLKEGDKVEAALRAVIQHHKASYLFIGSRRRLLRDMFESPRRPFYRGATTREMANIDPVEFSAHLSNVVESLGIDWPSAITVELVSTVRAHTYSVTAIAHALYESTVPNTPTIDDLSEAINVATNRESSLFTSILSSLSPQSRMLLVALAVEPTAHPMSNPYIRKHGLTTPATVKKSLLALIEEDHITIEEGGIITLTDPLLARWLTTRWSRQLINAKLPLFASAALKSKSNAKIAGKK